MNQDQTTCPKCSAPLGEIVETKTGRKLKRCSTNSWNAETRTSEGCDFVLWLQQEPQALDERCPKCSGALVLQFTRFGKKMKKCSNGGWDKETRKPTGCDFVEWISGTTENLDESCPQCSSPLVLYTSAAGKKMKKCSTAGWDPKERQATGCAYVYWLKPGEYPKPAQEASSEGEEFLPPAE